MVTLTGSHANLEGLSTDQKPLDVAVNTLFVEYDTGDVYYFDTDKTWKLFGWNDGE